MAQDKHPVVVSENGLGPYQRTVHVGRHTLVADEPLSLGGNDAGPEPMDFLLASLGACTSITLRMYAERKQLPLTGIRVELLHDRVDSEKHGKVDRIVRTITLEGELTAAQRAGLLAIANKCPMYRTLQSDLRIDSSLADRSAPETAE
ncbi:MAG: OsmC family protein [Candidatus Accumulibacter sp.]|jgi:putative redox protein|uniref:OsmC family protein n=1 Tax=Accumulibacter sp. TaxID=2053492 RepID=UPI001AD24460|nr:OsmC family protein [Accumulibacter sp.]MBK8115781.1 OsmC family protein [Accumulibacter sp.]MBK8385968.1 OsmC family protein [Accumulibacter sp.]MBK8577528.1 OsmC family protein [Candidatus Accumulibacter propinquus]MBN8437351.1 OsmC family protein [Accumulibacter sp.]